MAAYRAQGDSWQAILKSRSIKPTDIYFMISGRTATNRFAPIFARFDSTPQDHWDNLVFEDEEIVDLINLRFVYRQYDYSAFKVMNLRESGNSWVVIHDSVRDAREKMIKDEKAKAKAAKKMQAEEETETKAEAETEGDE